MTKQEFIAWTRQVGPQYRCSSDVSQQLAELELVAVVGPTGAGKTTLIDAVKVPIVKSDVTRDRRHDERRDDTYNFRTDYEAVKRDIESGMYVQFVVSQYGEFYGTHIRSYPQRGRCIMSIVAEAVPHFERLGFKDVFKVYIMPPGYVEWLRRIGKDRSSSIDERMDEARTSIKLAMRDDEYNYILNDDLKAATRDFKRLLKSEELNPHRTQLTKETANLLLKRLGDQDDDELYL